MATTTVYAKSGCTVYSLITMCDDTPITSSDVSAISYSIYKIGNFKTYTPVEGHENQTIPLSALQDTLQTEPDTGESYNFLYAISAKTHFPFPDRNEVYQIEFQFNDLEGEPHIISIQCKT